MPHPPFRYKIYLIQSSVKKQFVASPDARLRSQCIQILSDFVLIAEFFIAVQIARLDCLEVLKPTSLQNSFRSAQVIHLLFSRVQRLQCIRRDHNGWHTTTQFYKETFMNKSNRTLLNFFLGAVTCLLLVTISTPSMGKNTSTFAKVETAPVLNVAQTAQMGPQDLINQQLASNLQDAETVLLAQTSASSPLTRYVAVMTKDEVVGTTPSTFAFGAAGAALVGDRLIVRGDFSNLSGSLRDYTTDPVNPPNPNITSAAHIHQGEAGKNGPFQQALRVDLNNTGLGGRLAGEYTLTSEQLQALSAGQLYLDIHTKTNRAGELRGVLRPY